MDLDDSHDAWVAKVRNWHARVLELQAEGLTYPEASQQAREELDTASRKK